MTAGAASWQQLELYADAAGVAVFSARSLYVSL